MMFDAFQHSFSTDQQRKIIQEIQIINKKLTNKSNAIKLENNPYANKQNNQSRLDQKYFSEQCEELFKDQNDQNPNATYNDSLFNSQNDMLLDNYQKQIKNFREFETNKFSSGNPQKKTLFSKNTTELFKIFESQKSKNSDNSLKKQKELQLRESQAKSQTKKSTAKNPAQNSNKIPRNNQSQSHIKTIAQSKIKRYIQNKQNILPTSNMQKQNNTSNMQKQKFFINQVKKRIRFDTQPDYCHQQRDHNQDSLQLFNQKQADSYRNNFRNQCKNNSKQSNPNRIKYDTNKSELQCTFKPSILKKSNQIAEHMQPSFQRLTQDVSVSKSQSKLPYKTKQQLSTKKYSVKRLDQLSQPRRLKTIQHEQQKYMFQPCLSKKSLQQMANCTLDVASRNQIWLQQKQAKLVRLKVEEQEHKLKKQSGSYAPKLTQYKGQTQVHLSRFAKQGISTYFQRISMVKQRNSIHDKKKPLTKEQPAVQNGIKMKKKTYDQAVKELHKKILTMNI